MGSDADLAGSLYIVRRRLSNSLELEKIGRQSHLDGIRAPISHQCFRFHKSASHRNCIQYLLRWKSYTISPKEFRSIASKAQGANNAASAVSRLTTDLRRTYGTAIAIEPYWVALTLGGIPLKALFLHASMTEFIAVIGTPYPVAGRIGSHWSNSTCTVLMGSVVRLPDVSYIPNKETFSAGGNFRHGQFESYIYNLGAETYAVCYGRGIIPVSGLWAATGALHKVNRYRWHV
ncbi:hypothetical protein KIN20_012810 [Parelaphostrongylus tenuis]|uniref:Sigma non-opioid intracellular receptor 1 n=1 Tax=Parelaphostrongylus tenuis TaxID=148309 RepID=A0AAD5MCN8_PARTN|nr:hypothetical protein KIN20_012810 [Parelaphostrongylus tenuis]